MLPSMLQNQIDADRIEPAHEETCLRVSNLVYLCFIMALCEYFVCVFV